MYELHKRFRNGNTSFEGYHHNGHPLTSTANENTESHSINFINAKRRLTIAEIASEVRLSHGNVHGILYDSMNVYRVCSHIVREKLSP